MKKLFISLTLFILAVSLTACSSGRDTVLTYNPYEGVNFDNITQVKAGLHNHTTYSDGSNTPDEVVDIYKELDYGALAITDHDNVAPYDSLVWPWEAFSTFREGFEDRDPAALEMIAIPGVEYSYHHHMVALYTLSLPGQSYEEADLLDMLQDKEEALTWFAHPGREWNAFEEYEEGDVYSPSWYKNFFETYDSDTLLGLEVFSQRDRHEYDRVLWDTLLTDLMPTRPIFGFAVDDFHGSSAGFSYTKHLIEDSLDENQFRDSLLNGAFFAVSKIELDDSVPFIENIIIDEDNKTITIEASDYDRINWISGITEEGYHSNVIQSGEVFDYSTFELDYIRAEVIAGNEGSSFLRQVHTQPFGFDEAEE